MLNSLQHTHISLWLITIWPMAGNLYKNYQEAIELRKKYLPEDHLNFETCCDTIATYYDYVGKCGEALEYRERALEIRRKHHLN